MRGAAAGLGGKIDTVRYPVVGASYKKGSVA